MGLCCVGGGYSLITYCLCKVTDRGWTEPGEIIHISKF